MKDRFKFRGLSKGKWYYGAYFKHLPYTPYCCGEKPPEKDYQHFIIQEGFSDWGLPRSMTCIEVEKDTVGQCTGLKDKNGKLIYEGDIVSVTGKNGMKFIYIVKYSDPEYKWILIDNYSHNAGKKARDFYKQYVQPKELYKEGYRVIGNIYENPELLEV